MDRHIKNYHLLGIRPGDSRQKLRQAYKLAIRKWHPDRFSFGDSDRDAAEERTKEINRAYQELQEYFQKNGCMPLDVKQPTPRRPDELAISPAPPQQCGVEVTEANHRPWTPANKRATKNNAGRRSILGLFFVAIPLLGYHFFLSPDDFELPVTNWFSGASVAVPDTQMEQAPQKVKRKYFTNGSSLGEVHSIQGIPTKIEDDIWYYGDAKVFFKNGKVSHWIDSADHRLLARPNQEPQAQETVVQYFSKGSTKAEVRAIQGTPLRETDNLWDYGISRIYFERDKVVGWHESPLEPLRIKR